MDRVRSFRDLIAWQKGMNVARLTYRASMSMPASERFGLTAQMRRAAVSIPSNIAEGYARQSRRDYIKYLRIARASHAELATQIQLAIDLEMLRPNPSLVDAMREAERVLQALLMSLERKDRAASS
jgi:four helix bundle protein